MKTFRRWRALLGGVVERLERLGGVQAVLCDGSARYFSQTISINIWRALTTSKGGEPNTLN